MTPVLPDPPGSLALWDSLVLVAAQVWKDPKEPLVSLVMTATKAQLARRGRQESMANPAVLDPPALRADAVKEEPPDHQDLLECREREVFPASVDCQDLRVPPGLRVRTERVDPEAHAVKPALPVNLVALDRLDPPDCLACLVFLVLTAKVAPLVNPAPADRTDVQEKWVHPDRQAHRVPRVLKAHPAKEVPQAKTAAPDLMDHAGSLAM